MIMVVAALSSCDMMTEDLSDCPTGLYVNFVYDYNIQRADMFKDHDGLSGKLDVNPAAQMLIITKRKKYFD